MIKFSKYYKKLIRKGWTIYFLKIFFSLKIKKKKNNTGKDVNNYNKLK